MRKLIILTSILFLNILFVNAQITVVTDDSTYTPTSNNAIFEVHSSNGNKGILVPRLTTAQRTAIATSGNIDQSLLVFDTDTKTFWFYDGSAWVEMATGGTVSDDQNIDSLTLNGLTLTTYIENGQPGSVDLTPVSDSAVTYIINHSDTLFNNPTFNDSIITIINNNFDTLFYNQSFVDSLISVFYNNSDTLLYDSTFVNSLRDSIDTDVDNADLTGTTLNIYENGNVVSVDLSSLVNDADSDPTNEIELPQTAINGQVLTWNGSAWVAQNSASGADNWGTQVVESDNTLNGDGTSGNPLSVNGDLTDDQQLNFSGTTLSLTDGGSVDLSSLQDGTGTDDQQLSLSGNVLSIEDGNSVTLPTGADNWGTQVVESDNTLNGDGTSGNPLSVNGDLTDDQQLNFSGTTLSLTDGGSVDLSSLQDGIGTDDQNIQGCSVSGDNLIIGIENGNSQTVDMSHFMDNTDNQALSISDHTISLTNGGSVTVPDNDTQDLSLSGNTLSLTNGGSVDLSTITSNNSWNITGNSGTGSSNFIGTTDNVALNFKIDNTEAGKLSKDNTYFGYQAGYSVSSGTYNSFFGYTAGKAITTGGYNTALGYCAINRGSTGGSSNIAIGKFSMFYAPSGDYNIAIGNSAYSLPSHTGTENVYIGDYAETDNNDGTSYAVALGGRAIADANYATAIGYRAYANQPNTLILGQINGVNGATNSTKVGIGTTSPTATLDIKTPNLSTNEASLKISPIGHNSSSTSEFSLIDFWSTFDNYSSDQAPRRTASIKAHYIGGTWGYEALSICVGDAGDVANEPTERVRIVDDNRGSNLVAGGSWGTLSDKRLKTDIRDIPYGLNEILKLKPVKYVIHDPKNFNDIPKGTPKGHERVEIGFIAQDIYKIIPNVVNKPKDESKQLWTMKYERLTPVLVKAIQELKAENDELKAQLKSMNKRLERLENK